MRNPNRGRTIGLCCVGLGALSFAVLWLGSGHGTGVWVALFVCGALGVPVGGLLALFQHQDVRAKQALARGENIIARWRVEAEDWQRFVATDPQWSSHANGRWNEFVPSKNREPNGVEVIVGKAGVLIGESIHRLSPRSTPEITEARLHEGSPAIIELLLYHAPYATRFGMSPARYTALRFPVAPGALAEARQAVAHFGGDLPGEPDFFHGRGDGTEAEDLSTCYNCGFETHKFRSHCPKCGTTLQSRRWSRRFGLVLVVCGFVICGLMSFAVLVTVPSLLNTIEVSGGMGFSGAAGKARMVLAIFGGVLAFGLTALGYGLWQMITGRRSKRVIRFAVALAIILLLLVFAL